MHASCKVAQLSTPLRPGWLRAAGRRRPLPRRPRAPPPLVQQSRGEAARLDFMQAATAPHLAAGNVLRRAGRPPPRPRPPRLPRLSSARRVFGGGLAAGRVTESRAGGGGDGPKFRQRHYATTRWAAPRFHRVPFASRSSSRSSVRPTSANFQATQPPDIGPMFPNPALSCPQSSSRPQI